MLEPTALLIASSFAFAIDALMLTEASGRLVPIATIVSPIIIDGTCNLFATLELPSTKKSAPLINNTNPTTNKIYSISFLLFYFYLFCSIIRKSELPDVLIKFLFLMQLK